jgi:hypothetical protein
LTSAFIESLGRASQDFGSMTPGRRCTAARERIAVLDWCEHFPGTRVSDWTARMPDLDLEVLPSPQIRRQLAVAEFDFYATYDGGGSA